MGSVFLGVTLYMDCFNTAIPSNSVAYCRDPDRHSKCTDQDIDYFFIERIFTQSTVQKILNTPF